MKIGVRGHDFDAMPLAQLARMIKTIGYETIQLAPAKVVAEIPSIHEIRTADVKRIADVLHQEELDVSILGCYIEPSVCDKEQRMKNVETFRQNLKFAKILGAPIVGTETTHFPMPDETDREKVYQNLKDSIQRICETAEKENVLVGVEPVAEHTMNTPEITRRLLDEVKSDKLKVIFDASNLLLPETVGRQAEIFGQVYELLGSEIEIVHVKDFVIEGGAKKLTAIGDGVVDFPAIFRWLKKNRPDVPLLRENAKREYDRNDIARMKEYWRD